MRQDEEELITLSKWPFYLGDFLLVAMALAIAILGDWNLSDWQVLSCVMAVALGACIFVLPFIVEYYSRVTEQKEDRTGLLRMLLKRIEALEASIDEAPDAGYEDRFVALNTQIASAARAHEFLSEMVDQRSGDFEKVQAQLQGLLEGLHSRVDRIEAGAENTVHSDDLSALKQSIAELKDIAAQHKTFMSTAEGRIKNLEKMPLATVAEATEENPPGEKDLGRKPRKRKRLDGRLIHRAIQDKDVATDSAVGRIIESKHSKPSELVSGQELSAKNSKVDIPQAESEEAAEAASVSPVEETIEGDLDTIAASGLGADQMEELGEWDMVMPDVEAIDESNEDVLAPISTDMEAPVVSSPPEEPVVSSPPEEQVSQDSATTSAPKTMQPEKIPQEDLFGETPVASTPASRARQKRKGTLVRANILIGIGNKPYLRGSGGGLSWDKGVPMDFEEIGKWIWNESEPFTEAIEVQVFKNDEQADRNGRYTLQPAARLELDPIF